MITTASSADPQTNNLPSSSSSPSSMAQQQQARENPNSISNFNPKSTPKLPQRSRRSITNTATTTTTTTSNNSDILPNFSSLPCFNVRWGRRQQLRCVNDERSTQCDDNSDDNDDDGGIHAMRDKLMLDFRNQVQKIHADFIHNTNTNIGDGLGTSKTNHHNHNHNHNDDKNKNNSKNNNNDSANVADTRPWNLRTRRAVCKDPNGAERKPTTSSPAKPTEAPKSLFNFNGGNEGNEGTRRKKFSLTLTKQEIEEDLIAMGISPTKRPKKRPKHIQRVIDGIFPGSNLTEITAEMYKVKEHP